MGRIGHQPALVEIGLSTPAFRRALAGVFEGLSLPCADSLDAAFGLSGRALLVVGEGVDPVAPIRSCANHLRPNVLVVCERAQGSEVARWARAGVTNCFVGVESLAELHAAVRSPARNDSRDVSLDATDLAIEIADTRTRLTRTQFRLFHHLATNGGRWVTASELVKEALGTHHEDESALVRVHIHAIRRALGPLAQLIETDPARARGYRFRNDLVERQFSATVQRPRHPFSERRRSRRTLP